MQQHPAPPATGNVGTSPTTPRTISERHRLLAEMAHFRRVIRFCLVALALIFLGALAFVLFAMPELAFEESIGYGLPFGMLSASALWLIQYNLIMLNGYRRRLEKLKHNPQHP